MYGPPALGFLCPKTRFFAALAVLMRQVEGEAYFQQRVYSEGGMSRVQEGREEGVKEFTTSRIMRAKASGENGFSR